MLHFFRKYQRYIFLLVTIVIIISFSFFGTQGTLDSNPNVWREQVAFKAVNGHDVTRLELEDMVNFLSTDNEDKKNYGGIWGPNFLNDGVIQKDFLETGLGLQLALAYQEDIQEELNRRLVKEQSFKLYSHPEAPFVGTEQVWSYFSPGMLDAYRNLMISSNSLDENAFKNRVELFLLQKQIPSSTLRYILKYQEKQYSWLKPDPLLDQMDLSLFGYHTIGDWFSPQYIRLVSEFIINAAILAQQQGYEVTRAEVIADLMKNTQISYEQNLNNPALGVTSPEQYLNEQLRLMHMDLGRTIKVWQQVLLFRRYFQDVGAIALVDPLVSQQLNHFAYENVNVDIYRIPMEFRLNNFEALENFEAYLYAVGKQNKNDPLYLPEDYLPLNKIEEKYPELIQKNYLIELAEVDTQGFKGKIGLKDLWKWEIENWDFLKNEFPSLAVQSSDSREMKFEALERLDQTTRSKVDAFAKIEIIKQHPEWIEQALDQAAPKTITLSIRKAGGKLPILGLEDSAKKDQFISLLDQAEEGKKPEEGSPLHQFSVNEKNFYRITVLEKNNHSEILTFAEALKDGTIDAIKNRLLENYYLAVREKSSSAFQNADGKWKPFSEVKALIANQYFEKILKALAAVQKNIAPDESSEKNKDLLASLRFYPYLDKVKKTLELDPQSKKNWIKDPANRSSLANQWKVEKENKILNRQSQEENIDIAIALQLPAGSWSSLITSPNGNLTFYQVNEKGESLEDQTIIATQVKEIQSLFSDEAQRLLMNQIIEQLKEKGAISLDLNNSPENVNEAASSTIVPEN